MSDQIINESAEYVRQKLASLDARLTSLESSVVKRVRPFDDLDLFSWYDPTHASHVGVVNGEVICLPDLLSWSHLHISPGSRVRPQYGFFSDGKPGLLFSGNEGLASHGSSNNGPITRHPPYTIMVAFELTSLNDGIVFQYSAAGGGKRIQLYNQQFYISDASLQSQVVPQLGVKYVVFYTVTEDRRQVVWFEGSSAPIVEEFGGSTATHIGISLGCGAQGESPFRGIIGPCAEFTGELGHNKMIDYNDYVRGVTEESLTPPPQSWNTLSNGTVVVGTSVAQNGGGGHTQVPWPVTNLAIGGSTVDLVGTSPSISYNPLCATVAEYDAGSAEGKTISGSSSNSYENRILAHSPDRLIWHYAENSQPYTAERIGGTEMSNTDRGTIAGAWHWTLNRIYAALPDIEIFFVTKWRGNDPLVDQMIRDIAAARPETIHVVELNQNHDMIEPLDVPGEWTNDGVHPSSAGIAKLGDTFRVLMRDY